jgi:hypothetical protein
MREEEEEEEEETRQQRTLAKRSKKRKTDSLEFCRGVCDYWVVVAQQLARRERLGIAAAQHHQRSDEANHQNSRKNYHLSFFGKKQIYYNKSCMISVEQKRTRVTK